MDRIVALTGGPVIHFVAYQPYQPTTDFGRALFDTPEGIASIAVATLNFLGWLYMLTPHDWPPAMRLMVYPVAYGALMVATWPIRWLRRRKRKPKAKLGAAVFAGLFSIWWDGMLRPGGRYLGRYPLLMGLTGLDMSMHGEGHSLAIAPPGSGKTSGGVIPTLLAYRRGSIIVTDPKGEVTALTKRFRSTLGRVAVLNPWRMELLNDPSFGVDLGDTGFNFCQKVGPHAEGRSAAASIAALLLTGDRNNRDSYFYNDGRELLEYGMLFLSMAMPGKLNPASLRTFLYNETGLVGSFKAVLASDRQGPAWNTLREAASKFLPMSVNAPQQWIGVHGTATTALKIYNADTRLGQHTSRDGFRLSDLRGDDPVTVFIVCPPGHLISDDRRWLNMVLAVLMQEIGQPGVERETVLLVDELPALGFLPSLMPSLEQYRGSGLRGQLFAQSAGSIVDVYGQDGMARLLGVCDTKQFFRFTDHAKARDVSEWMGQIAVESVSVNERGERTTSMVGVPLLRPEELTKMRRNRQIIFRPGMPPIRARVHPYFKRPAWRGLVDVNPYRAGKRRKVAAARPASANRQESRP